MQIFNLDDDYKVVCNWQSRENGFSHIATLNKNGVPLYRTSVKYDNRTWESYEYKSILKKVVDCYFEGDEYKRETYIEQIKRGF